MNDYLPICICQIQFAFSVGDSISTQWLSFGDRDRPQDRAPLCGLSIGAARHTIDDDLVDENLVALVGDAVNQTYLFILTLLRKLNDRQIESRIWIPLSRIKCQQPIAI